MSDLIKSHELHTLTHWIQVGCIRDSPYQGSPGNFPKKSPMFLEVGLRGQFEDIIYSVASRVTNTGGVRKCQCHHDVGHRIWTAEGKGIPLVG